jgi:hypothetical protein
MKTIVALCAVLFCGVALADDGKVSVLNHGAAAASPTPAAVPTAPAQAAAPVASKSVQRCESGQCRLQTFTAQEQAHDVTRRRVLGGYVVRKGSRTVLRPTR